MSINYENFEQYFVDMIDDLSNQEEFKYDFSKKNISLKKECNSSVSTEKMTFDENIDFWKELIEHNESTIAYEIILSSIDDSSFKIKGHNVIELILIALFLGNYVAYESLLDRPVSFTDDKKMILSEEDFNQYLMDVIDDLSLQKRFEDSMPKQGVLAYETIIGLLNKYPCKLDGKNVVKLIFIALSLGDDINYESLLKK